MKFIEGQIVKHILTNEKVLILNITPAWNDYNCRLTDYTTKIFEEQELDFVN